MFTRDGVTLRPLEPDDIEVMYPWHLDYELEILSSWEARRSFALFQKRWESKILEPEDDMLWFGIAYENRLVGRIQLAMIDREQRRAEIGILIGDRTVWGRGIGTRALRMLIDYAFMVENLEKVYAEVYAFNLRSQRLMEAAGFTKEGVLRAHEMHNGARVDVALYGVLKQEFYQGYATMFRLPGQD